MYFEFAYYDQTTACVIWPGKMKAKDQRPLVLAGVNRHFRDKPNKRKGRNAAAAEAIRTLVPGDRRTDPGVLQERRLAWETLRAQGVRV